MIDELSALIEKHWSIYGRTEPYERYRISFTKFCQRVVQPHTKVLYFVTYREAPLCILKTVRGPEYNENLLREAKYQAAAPRTAVLSAPRVFWTDEVRGRAVYAEEYIDALPVSLHDYRALAPEIATFSAAMPQSGTIRSDEFADRIAPFVPEDPVLTRHLATLRALKAPLQLGLSHGDMGRQNILGTATRAWVIDWERAGDVPVRYFDLYATDFRLRKRWGRASVPSLTVSEEVEQCLVAVTEIYVRLYSKYLHRYRDLAAISVV